MYILQSYSYSPIESVVDISTDVEVISADISRLCTIHVVGIAVISIEGAVAIGILFVIDIVGIKIIQLTKLYIVGEDSAVFIKIQEIVIRSKLIVSQLVLRRTIKVSYSIQNLIEIAALGVVERKIQE